MLKTSNQSEFLLKINSNRRMFAIKTAKKSELYSEPFAVLIDEEIRSSAS